MQPIDRLIEKSKSSLCGFTLVEMLIVVAILAVLMTIVFKLGSLGGADSARTTTVIRMQKIENCLSGYYAAFGSYPPVKRHGSPDVFYNPSGGRDTTLDSGRVIEACRVQPFGCEYPPGDEPLPECDGKSERELVREWAEELSAKVNNAAEYPNYAPGKWKSGEKDYGAIFSGGMVDGPDVGDGAFQQYWSKSADWKNIKLFKFGVMSFLLPRYLFMMGYKEIFDGTYGIPKQWGDNNDLPCDPYDGDSFQGWDEVYDLAKAGNKSGSTTRKDMARLANIPSQAVCARWISNLEGVCRGTRKMTIFGVTVSNGGLSTGTDDTPPPDPGIRYPSPDGSGTPYKNASMTILDGWENEFFYYSPPPYQSYVVWSSGPNEKTFPPWVSVETLQGDNKKKAMEWKADDIMQMSH